MTNWTQTNTQLTTLLNYIGKKHILQNIEKYISYYKNCESQQSLKYFSEITYTDNLDQAQKSISENIHLKAAYYLEDCYSVVDLLNSSYHKLLLDHADCICLNKNTTHILKLTNSKDPKSNIAIIVDIDLIKQDLIEEDKKRQAIIFNRNLIDWIGCTFLWVIFIGGIGSMICKKSK